MWYTDKEPIDGQSNYICNYEYNNTEHNKSTCIVSNVDLGALRIIKTIIKICNAVFKTHNLLTINKIMHLDKFKITVFYFYLKVMCILYFKENQTFSLILKL